jgi:lipoate-protein ligase B
MARARITGELNEDLLLLVEHPPVVTLGRSSKERHLLASPAMLEARGIELHEVERGGDVTFHGPGQLVGYPIIDLKRHKQDLHWYLRQVEEALIRALTPLGIHGERSVGQTGVWSDGRKLASIGVHARDWVVWHGFALNVTTDLSFFDVIVPCGIAGVRMSSVEQELALRGDAALPTSVELGRAVRQHVLRGFSEVFSLEPAELDPAVLDRVAATTVPI